MSATIQFTPTAGQMNCELSNIATLPGDIVRLNVPEFIGDAAQPCVPTDITVTWSPLAQGAWRAEGHKAGELSYQVLVTPTVDSVDLLISVTNKSARVWADSFAFNCCGCRLSAPLRDHEGMRLFGRAKGAFHRLAEVNREFSVRPTVQVYSIEGAPSADSLPYIALFGATSKTPVEGWMALQSRDGTRLAATVAKPAAFLFNNLEFSCIHSAPSFGALLPGQTGHGRTRLYFVQSTLDDWYVRMLSEL